MFSISETSNGDVEEVKLVGRLDVKAAKDTDASFAGIIAKRRDVVLDFSELEYIASAGLRALKRLLVSLRENGNSLTIKNVQYDVMEIFEMTAPLAGNSTI